MFHCTRYNVRPTNLNAAIGIEQLKKLKKLIDIRRKNYKFFNKIFKNDDRFIFQKFNKEHSCFAFTLILKPKYKHLKNKIFESLRKNKIEFRLITGGSFFKHPVQKYFNYSKFNGSKNVDYVHENGFFVGNHPKDLKKELTFLKHTKKYQMKILITGGAGYIGSTLCEYLLNNNHQDCTRHFMFSNDSLNSYMSNKNFSVYQKT